MDFRSCWLASRAAGFPGRPVLQTQSPASMTSHSWALLPMLGSCGVGPWGPGGGQATRNSWLREWAGGEELALAQVPLCTGRLRLTGVIRCQSHTDPDHLSLPYRGESRLAPILTGRIPAPASPTSSWALSLR